MTRTCPECQTELVDINEDHGIHYDHPYYVCPNTECERSPYHKDDNTDLLIEVLSQYQEPDDLADCYQNREMRTL